jgi:carboxyl-terminal processing protease
MKPRYLRAALPLVAALAVFAGPSMSDVDATGDPTGGTCRAATPEPAPLTPTTVDTVGQAYHCVFDHYFGGPVLDSRSMLVPAFATLTQELQRRGLDRPDATLPALTGDRHRDWAAFRRTYVRVTAPLPALRQTLAEVTMTGMLAGLHDNHVRWQRSFPLNTTGVETSATNAPGHVDPVATAPLYVTRVLPDSAAEAAGIAPGDEIVAVNGVPPYVDGTLARGVLDRATASPAGVTVAFSLRRPATGETLARTVTAGPGVPVLPRTAVESRMVGDRLAYVSLPSFVPGSADRALAAVAALGESRGMILDLRGNGGGFPNEVSRLLGALVHNKVINYWCDVRDRCTPNRTDDSVRLLRLPVVVLTDRACASACDAFAGAVRNLTLGTLVGTRTAGLVSGAALQYRLSDGTTLVMPSTHEVGANREIYDTIGVPPHHVVPLTAADLSAGRDPGLDKAIALLR